MQNNTNLYISKCQSYIRFMLSMQQWSGLEMGDIDRWIDNFRELTPEEMYFVYKLLTNVIYFSEKDVISVLAEGLHCVLFGKLVLEKQIENDFQLSSKTIANLVTEELENTCFTPLLDRDAPHESANYVTRLLVKEGLIGSNQSLFLNNIVSKIEDKTFKRLVIVDDCLGSGDQLRDFWLLNSKVQTSDGELLLKDYCIENSIPVTYLVLFGYDKSVERLKHDLSDISIECIKKLSDNQRVFSDTSYIWKDKSEMEKAKTLFEEITTNAGIQLLGYKKFDFAFIMHQTIPDWSLPLFWKESPEWKWLIRRKNSNA